MLYSLRYRDQFGVKDVLVEASSPEKAEAVSTAWCTKHGFVKPNMGVVTVKAAVVADESIFRCPFHATVEGTNSVTNDRCQLDVGHAGDHAYSFGGIPQAPAADPLAGMTEDELERATNPTGNGAKDPVA